MSIFHRINHLGALPKITLLAGLAAALLFAFPALQQVMMYDRTLSGEWWRWATGHWVHWNAEHLFWSLGAFLFLGGLCEQRNMRSFLWTMVGAVLFIPAVLYVLQPHLLSYGGLSGLDSALFGLAAVSIIREKYASRDWTLVSAGLLLLAAFVVKVVYEWTTGGALFVSDLDAMKPVPLAHLAGILVGMLAALLEDRSAAPGHP